jgi:hypothetical protein
VIESCAKENPGASARQNEGLGRGDLALAVLTGSRIAKSEDRLDESSRYVESEVADCYNGEPGDAKTR